MRGAGEEVLIAREATHGEGGLAQAVSWLWIMNLERVIFVQYPKSTFQKQLLIQKSCPRGTNPLQYSLNLSFLPTCAFLANDFSSGLSRSSSLALSAWMSMPASKKP